MQGNARKRAQAIAVARQQNDQMRKLGLLVLAISMTAACAYGFMALVF